MRRFLTALLMTPALFLAPRTAGAAEMSSDPACAARASASVLGQSGLPAGEVGSLDAVEREEILNADPDRKGGDGLITIAVLLAIVALVYIYFQHVENMSRG